MPLIVAVWPNDTVSIVKMRPDFSMVELFDRLDEEANPHDARCYVVTPTGGHMHITFNKEEGRRGLSVRTGETGGRARRIKWPDGIEVEWLRSFTAGGDE